MTKRKRILITDDGNQRLEAVEQELAEFLNKDPDQHETLKVSHLMGAEVVGAEDTRVSREIDAILPRDLRARAVGAAMFKNFLSNPILLHEMYLLGATTHGRGWVEEMKATMRPDSLASGLTDKELYKAWAIYEYNVQLLSQRVQWRKRKDSTI